MPNSPLSSGKKPGGKVDLLKGATRGTKLPDLSSGSKIKDPKDVVHENNSFRLDHLLLYHFMFALVGLSMKLNAK